VATSVTYFGRFIPDSGTPVVSNQALLELAATRFVISREAHLTKQSTRYSAHGIHEYKGKFNPQVVHAIGNILGLKKGDWLFDPFCGCGTTLLEAAHNAWNAIGMDLNPLGTLITQAKIASMHVSPRILEHSVTAVKDTLSQRSLLENRERLDNLSRNYLSKWFEEPILAQLNKIAAAVEELESGEVRIIFKIILSDLVRSVSLQDPSDLRIRRRKEPLPRSSNIISAYLDHLGTRVRSILTARRLLKAVKTRQESILGDSRNCYELVARKEPVNSGKGFDAVITSPPYATALPYIDTQRLSLVLLGLLKPADLAITEKRLIGSREIRDRERQALESSLRNNESNLPALCMTTCRELLQAFDEESDGFRRRNVPALLYKYLSDMKLVLDQVKQILKRRGSFALLVGRNRTRLGGREYLIDTPKLLVEIGQELGYRVRLFEDLEAYQRYDLHQSNSIRSEVLAVLSTGP